MKLTCRFRHYYRHILLLQWLKPNSHNAPTGLILASTFGLQVAAHLAYSENHRNQLHSNDSSLKKTSPRPLKRPELIVIKDEAKQEEFDLQKSQPPTSKSTPFQPCQVDEVLIIETQEGQIGLL